MSEEKVERVRAGYELFNRTHEPDYDLLHPAARWHTAPDLPDSGTHHGHDGIKKLFSEWAGSFENFRADIDEIIDAGDSVVVVAVLRGRIKGSSEEVVLPESYVWKFEDRKAIEVREYRTKAEALEAVGLSE